MSGDQILIRHGVDLKAFREEILPATRGKRGTNVAPDDSNLRQRVE
jgi:hypothetical protein